MVLAEGSVLSAQEFGPKLSSMTAGSLLEFHQRLGAQWIEVSGEKIPAHYGDVLAEYTAMREAAVVLDLSFRGRLCLTGADRQRFLHGQVTHDVNGLKAGEGCYAALVTAKGRIVSDLNLYLLADEILLDFEPGLVTKVKERLEKFIIADDAQVVDAAPHYGLLSVQGPKAAEVLRQARTEAELPVKQMTFRTAEHSDFGQIYLINCARLLTSGFDVFVPTEAMEAAAERLVAAAESVGGRPCGWQALEIARVEAGIPRFGVDMDESNLAPEAGIESRAISYSKGCYTGQEVIARIRTYGQVARALRRLRLADDLSQLPARGDKLFKDSKEVGYITSAVRSPGLKASLALGYVRKETNQAGTELSLDGNGGAPVRVLGEPFQAEW
ncbi:MAG: aminomethyl transferase family protein [Verrucomicrobia bacterium]|nr:aminomethyl transferase family protein [Verrucomicrobiota bacterium]